ncbi:MAG: allantoicase [Propionibacteriales bacterium]|nr:allantoicase [Propionibacteriales bacterium]
MSDGPAGPAFAALPDLASRQLAGSVVAANDELFAQRENLIRLEPAVFDDHEFGHKGKVYDGWETRRRREAGHDWAVVRLGVPGVVHGVVADTAWFTGNYPPFVSIEALRVDGYPSPEELHEFAWTTLVEKAAALGDTANAYPVANPEVWTHARLSIYPDGGVARFRVHGEVVPDPRFLVGTVDLAALENGGTLVGCSDAFYSSPGNLIMPGRARLMGHGWENARRRDDGNDFAVFRLAGEGTLRHVEIDTSYFVGNAPGWVRLSACATDGDPFADDVEWWDAVPKTRSQPDTRHRYVVDSDRPATHVRLDVYPDGGLARLRVWGELTDTAMGVLKSRWA